MNRLSDIIEMGGNLYEEAWNNGRREALKEVQNGKYEKLEEINRALQAQIDNYETIRRTKDEQIHRYEEQLNMLHEMRQKLEAENQETTEKLEKAQQENACLTDDKRKLVQNLDHVIDENNDLELTIGRLKADLDKVKDEKTVLQAKVDSFDGVSREQAKEVNRLKGKVKELNEALAIYRVPTPRDCPFCGGPAEVHQLHKGEWYVACGNDSCPVNPETNCFDTEADAIEAWNNSYNFKATCDWR